MRGAQNTEPQEDTVQQIATLSATAEQGDTEAQWKLARLYDNGFDVPQDNQQAAYWYSKVAIQGETLGRV